MKVRTRKEINQDYWKEVKALSAVSEALKRAEKTVNEKGWIPDTMREKAKIEVEKFSIAKKILLAKLDQLDAEMRLARESEETNVVSLFG